MLRSKLTQRSTLYIHTYIDEYHKPYGKIHNSSKYIIFNVGELHGLGVKFEIFLARKIIMKNRKGHSTSYSGYANITVAFVLLPISIVVELLNCIYEWRFDFTPWINIGAMRGCSFMKLMIFQGMSKLTEWEKILFGPKILHFQQNK